MLKIREDVDLKELKIIRRNKNMNKEQRINRVLAGLSHTGYTTEIERDEARILIEELEQQVQNQKEVIDKVKLVFKGIAYGGSEDYYIEKIKEINKLLESKGE